MTVPAALLYSKDHEWLKLTAGEDIALIGITDFAAGELGDIVFVDIETVGQSLQAGAVFGTIEAVKTVSDLFLPASGTITEVNPNLSLFPESVNQDPYGEGWLIKLKLEAPIDLTELLGAEDYEKLTGHV